MLHLYEATVCTNMMIVAKSRESAIKTAKIYASDEIEAYSKVSLADINHESLLSDEWKKLYPYIANKCIDKQQQCGDLIRVIQEQQKPQITPEKEEPEPHNPIVEEIIIPNKPEPEKPSSPSKPDIPQPGRGIKSPPTKDLPPLRF